jgi:hypothetical protein
VNSLSRCDQPLDALCDRETPQGVESIHEEPIDVFEIRVTHDVFAFRAILISEDRQPRQATF